MLLKGLIVEDHVNYKKWSMYLAFPCCTLKCNKLNGREVCQNGKLTDQKEIFIVPATEICKQFLSNPITDAIVCAGLEPFDTVDDLVDLIETLRFTFNDNSDIVIYTGYTEEEVLNDEKMRRVLDYKNIVVKYGRFIANDASRFDDVLGVTLASSNQYAKRYNYED